jgi:DNA-binding MarR family transcriptional regulator
MATAQRTTLGWSIGVLFRAWHDGMADALADIPHGARGHQILEFVAEGTLPTQAALAAHLGIDRTVLTYVLDDLVAAGVIERQTDAADRRVRRLAATDTGRAALVALDERVAAAEHALLRDLTVEQQSTLRAALDAASVAIHRGEPGHDACRVVIESLDGQTTERAAS